jgi:hypothetical protein
MNQELHEAYRQTTFYADTPRGRLALCIDQCDAQLDRLLIENACESWAYVTAYNPGSVVLSHEENQHRQASLENELHKRGWVFFSGEGVGSSGNWPPEPSVLVLGIGAATAQQLGRAFGQNAVVVGRLGRPAELVILN